MPTCCSVTFVVFVAIAMGASIASLYMPLFIVVPDDGDLDWSNSWSSDTGAVPHPSLHGLRRFGVSIAGQADHNAAATTPLRKAFKEQALSGLPRGSGQCPFFNGKCQIDGTEMPFTTDEVLVVIGCGDTIGSYHDSRFPRLWSIVAAVISFVLLVLGCLHMAKSRDLGAHGGFIKFGIAGIGAHYLGASGYSLYKQAMINKCIQDSGVLNLIPGDSVLLMISMIVLAFAAFIMLWCTLGMMCSWCCSCCGAPAGNQYNQNQNQFNVQMINAYPPVAVNPGYESGYPQAAGYPPAYGQLPPPQGQQQQAPYNPYAKQQY